MRPWLVALLLTLLMLAGCTSPTADRSLPPESAGQSPLFFQETGPYEALLWSWQIDPANRDIQVQFSASWQPILADTGELFTMAIQNPATGEFLPYGIATMAAYGQSSSIHTRITTQPTGELWRDEVETPLVQQARNSTYAADLASRTITINSPTSAILALANATQTETTGWAVFIRTSDSPTNLSATIKANVPGTVALATRPIDVIHWAGFQARDATQVGGATIATSLTLQRQVEPCTTFVYMLRSPTGTLAGNIATPTSTIRVTAPDGTINEAQGGFLRGISTRAGTWTFEAENVTEVTQDEIPALFMVESNVPDCESG